MLRGCGRAGRYAGLGQQKDARAARYRPSLLGMEGVNSTPALLTPLLTPSDAERRALTKKYRSELTDRIESFYANNPTSWENALNQLRNSDIDHIRDLQLGGQNVRSNLKSLDSRVNQALGGQISRQLPRGTQQPIVRINVEGLP